MATSVVTPTENSEPQTQFWPFLLLSLEGQLHPAFEVEGLPREPDVIYTPTGTYQSVDSDVMAVRGRDKYGLVPAMRCRKGPEVGQLNKNQKIISVKLVQNIE